MTEDVKRRYLNDPAFHAAVEMMRSFLRKAQLAPSEVREAAMLACIIEEEWKPFRRHALSCPAYGNYQPPYDCTCGADDNATNIVRTLGEEGRIYPVTEDNDVPLDSRGRLLAKLKELKHSDSIEESHYDADQALLKFINDDEITEAFNAIEKWYA